MGSSDNRFHFPEGGGVNWAAAKAATAMNVNPATANIRTVRAGRYFILTIMKILFSLIATSP